MSLMLFMKIIKSFNNLCSYGVKYLNIYSAYLISNINHFQNRFPSQTVSNLNFCFIMEETKKNNIEDLKNSNYFATFYLSLFVLLSFNSFFLHFSTHFSYKKTIIKIIPSKKKKKTFSKECVISFRYYFRSL